MRFPRESMISEAELKALVTSLNFTVANLQYRLTEDGRQFEYRMMLRTQGSGQPALPFDRAARDAVGLGVQNLSHRGLAPGQARRARHDKHAAFARGPIALQYNANPGGAIKWRKVQMKPL